MKRNRFLSVACVALLFCSGCTSGQSTAPSVELSSKSAVVSSSQEQSLPEEEKQSSAVFLAAGDNLIHDVIYLQAAARTGQDGYDFKPVYERIQKQVQEADLAFINQETPLVEGTEPSNYPRFNTPTEMARDLQEIGFDVLNLSNNHMLDQYADGLQKTLAAIRAVDGLSAVGAYENEAEREQIVLREANEITFAFLGYTQHTNGLRFSQQDAYMTVYLDDSQTIQTQIAKARTLADVVVVSVHWGEEGSARLTQYQKDKARELVEYGADVIIGTHPHVLQTIEKQTDSAGREAWVCYSLGNFVSAQIDPANLIGAMVSFEISKNHTSGAVTIAPPQLTPVVTDYGTGFRALSIWPLAEYSAEQASAHGIIQSFGKSFSLEYIKSYLAEVFDQAFLPQ